jgi:excisionase family DNA binding protein
VWDISDNNGASIKQEAKNAPVGALKIKDAANYLGGVSQITVRRLIDRGLIKPNRALRHLLIPVSELDRFLREGQR